MPTRHAPLAALLVIALLMLAGCPREEAPIGEPGVPAPGGKEIVIGSKNFTEQVIIGEIMAQVLEHHLGVKVDRKFNLGGTFVCFSALKQGDLDLYADYTGTGLTAVLEREVMRDADEVYDVVKEAYEAEFGLTWLEPFGFNNTYALTMRRADAERLNIKTISDLVPHASEMVMGCTYEFLERPDGYPGLKDTYGLRFKGTRGMDAGLTYRAAASEAVDVIDGFATDGRIPAFDLVILDDDRGFFPPYHAAPVVRMDVLERNPQIAEALNRLAGMIDDDTMRDMNYRVDEKNERPRDVAQEFLTAAGILQG